MHTNDLRESAKVTGNWLSQLRVSIPERARWSIRGEKAQGREGRHENGEGSGRGRGGTGQVTVEARRSKEESLIVVEESAERACSLCRVLSEVVVTVAITDPLKEALSIREA